MRADIVTVTLARDVPPGGRVGDTEAALLTQLETVVAALGQEVVEAPAPYKNSPVGRSDQYRQMRDAEGTTPYTEVRVRAAVLA